jgi:hypothetical protein
MKKYLFCGIFAISLVCSLSVMSHAQTPPDKEGSTQFLFGGSPDEEMRIEEAQRKRTEFQIQMKSLAKAQKWQEIEISYREFEKYCHENTKRTGGLIGYLFFPSGCYEHVYLVLALEKQGRTKEALATARENRIDLAYGIAEVPVPWLKYVDLAEKCRAIEEVQSIYWNMIRKNNPSAEEIRSKSPKEIDVLKTNNFRHYLPENPSMNQLRAMAITSYIHDNFQYIKGEQRPLLIPLLEEVIKLERNIPIAHYMLAEEFTNKDMKIYKIHMEYAARYGKGQVKEDAKKALANLQIPVEAKK